MMRQNQPPPPSPEKGIDLKSFLPMTIAVCFFAFLIIKEVQMPQAVIAAMTFLMGIMLLVKGIAQPEIVTYALVAYMPFSKELAGDFGGLATAFNFTNLLIGFMVWVWMTGRYSQNEPMWMPSSLNLPIFIFLALGAISIARANYYGGGYLWVAIIDYKRWITPIILYFLVLNTVKDRQIVKTVCVVIMIVTTVAALMAIWDYIDQGDCGSLEKCRIGGITEQPNMLAAFFNYYMFLPFGFFLQNLRRPKYWSLLVPFLLCFRGIMVTFSRGGYLAFAVGLYAITLLRSRVLFILLIIASYFVMLHPTLLPAGIRYRMGQTFKTQSDYSSDMMQEQNLETSSRRRVDVWKAGIDMVKENPMFGVGYGLFPYMIKYYWDGGEMDSHNTYLIIAAEMGIPALMIFMLIVLLIFWQTFMLYITTKDPFFKAFALGWMGGIFALLLSNMFGSRLDSQEVSSYLWIIAALVTRMRILDQRKSLEKPADPIGPQEPQKHIPWFERKGAY